MNNEETQQINSNEVGTTIPVQESSTPIPEQAPPVSPQAPVQPATDTPQQADEGVNLIPSMTKEEKVHVKKKNTLNIGSLLSIIILASVAMGIVGFNILSKAQLNSKKAVLARAERNIDTQIDKIISNNVILERVKLFESVKKNGFSHKKIVVFLNEMSGRVNGVSYRSISISEDLTFTVSGNSPDLEQLSRLWYLLGVNENLQTINLRSVSKTEEGASFSFEGTLLLENFKNN